MVALILLFFLFLIIHHDLDASLDFLFPPQEHFNLILAVMQSFHMEPVIVTSLERLHDRSDSADCIVHGCLWLIETPVVQIVTATHGEVVLHIFTEQRFIEQFVVTALDFLRCCVGNVLLPRFPTDFVSPEVHQVNELLTGAASLHGILDLLPQVPLPFRNMLSISFCFCNGQSIL